jgi:hypothetical protein
MPPAHPQRSYSREVFESIAKWLEPAWFNGSGVESGIRESGWHTRHSDSHSWSPCDEGDDLNSLDRPALPFPFTERQFAAWLIDGYGAHWLERIGGWGLADPALSLTESLHSHHQVVATDPQTGDDLLMIYSAVGPEKRLEPVVIKLLRRAWAEYHKAAAALGESTGELWALWRRRMVRQLHGLPPHAERDPEAQLYSDQEVEDQEASYRSRILEAHLMSKQSARERERERTGREALIDSAFAEMIARETRETVSASEPDASVASTLDKGPTLYTSEVCDLLDGVAIDALQWKQALTKNGAAWTDACLASKGRQGANHVEARWFVVELARKLVLGAGRKRPVSPDKIAKAFSKHPALTKAWREMRIDNPAWE